jgi:hypothetical protein
MKIMLGHICLMMFNVGWVTLIHPRLKFGLGYIVVWGTIFGLFSGSAHLLLLR